MYGRAGNDILDGGPENDHEYGEGGDDLIWGNFGADYIDGGDGIDTVDYSRAYDSVGVLMDGRTSSRGIAQGDVLISIEVVIGSQWGDSIRGSTGNDTIWGGAGNDSLSGSLSGFDAGADRIYGESGDDAISALGAGSKVDGGAGVDTYSYRIDSLNFAGPVRIEWAASPFFVMRDGIAEIELTSIERLEVRTGAGDDVLIGGALADQFHGGEGDDHLVGLDGADSLSGGGGDDLLESGEGHGNSLDGGAGDDRLLGGASNDSLSGGDGDDVIHGGAGTDHIYTGGGADRLWGGAGADTFIFNENRQTEGVHEMLDFESGLDTLTVPYGSYLPVTVIRVDGGSLVLGGEVVDGLHTIRGLVAGVLQGTDIDPQMNIGLGLLMRGAEEADDIRGSIRDDEISGLAGDDQLRGGSGDDVLDGGEGEDTAVFSGLAHDYRIMREGDGYRVKGADGSDFVTGVEVLKFDDISIELNLIVCDPVTGAVSIGDEAPLVLPGEFASGSKDGWASPWDEGDDPLILPGGLETKLPADDAPVACPPNDMAGVGGPVDRPLLDLAELGLSTFDGRDPHRLTLQSASYDWIV